MSLVTLATTNVIGWYQGDTLPLVMSVKNADDTAYDITGCTFAVTVYEASDRDTALFTLTNGSGISPLSLSGGTVTVSLSTVQSALLTADSSFPFKAVMTDASGSIITTSTGTFVSK